MTKKHIFRENDVALGDKKLDFTKKLSYENSEVGTIKLKFPNSDYYDLIEITDTGFQVSYYQGTLGNPQIMT